MCSWSVLIEYAKTERRNWLGVLNSELTSELPEETTFEVAVALKDGVSKGVWECVLTGGALESVR